MFDIQQIGDKAILSVFRLIGRIPRKTAIQLGNRLGHLLFLVDKRHRNIAIENLTHAFGDEKGPIEIRRLAKSVFMNIAQVIFEVGWSLCLDEERLFKHFELEGVSNLKAAYDKGRGVLALTAHFGNWELLTVAGAMSGYPLAVLYRPLDFKPLDRFFVTLRTRFGGKMIPQKRALREVLRSLKKRETVALLMDQNVDWYEGVFVDFMGRRACTNKGLALIALKSEAPVVPVFMVRQGERFITKILPEIPQ
ncbi:lysophospholipid acyltransferase family protein, partial [Thermodesulfobacteriota bacterium]